MAIVIIHPVHGEQEFDREWAIGQISGGYVDLEQENATLSDAQVADRLQDEFRSDPEYWEGRRVDTVG